MRTVPCIFPSDPSSACPTVPLPRIRPSVTPFCLSRADTSTAVSLTAAPLALISGLATRVPDRSSHKRYPRGASWPLSTHRDRIPENPRSQPIHPATPFAQRAAPLVRDRAPLVASAQTG